MSDVSNIGISPERRGLPRRLRSIYQVHYSLPKSRDEMAKPIVFKEKQHLNIQAYDLQVAGHRNNDTAKYIGLLQCNNGTILKPIIKESQRREVDFYNTLKSTESKDLLELRNFIPMYFGCKQFTYNGYENEYIILEDLTQNMLEPCIMDVKIGKRTWDPLATEQKIQNESSKYSECRRQYAFCIPGFQVYKLATGKLYKYGKDYGKKLRGNMVREALKTFLNASSHGLCRALILQFLSELWKIQKWCGKQRAVRLYSASLLLIYDAQRLRECCSQEDVLTGKPRTCIPLTGPSRRKSIHSMHTIDNNSSFSGQLGTTGPVFKKVNSVPLTSITVLQSTFTQPPPVASSWSDALEKLNNSHSFEHNYEDKLCKIKMNYKALLDQLSSDSDVHSPWGTVKIIDFAHAFFNEIDDESLDENFKEGIDNFVDIFEGFLKETDDQVF